MSPFLTPPVFNISATTSSCVGTYGTSNSRFAFGAWLSASATLPIDSRITREIRLIDRMVPPKAIVHGVRLFADLAADKRVRHHPQREWLDELGRLKSRHLLSSAVRSSSSRSAV